MLPELSPQLDDFVAKYVNNFIKWDLVVHFHEHRDAVATSKTIAGQLGRRPRDVEEALSDLVEAGILSEDKAGSELVYGLRIGGPRQQLVSDFVEALNSREQRLQILTKLLRLGARG